MGPDTDGYARQVEIAMEAGDARLNESIRAIDADVRSLDGREAGDWRALSAALEAGKEEETPRRRRRERRRSEEGRTGGCQSRPERLAGAHGDATRVPRCCCNSNSNSNSK
jgi:hypothetical protein